MRLSKRARRRPARREFVAICAHEMEERGAEALDAGWVAHDRVVGQLGERR